jgi:hypothetical protein
MARKPTSPNQNGVIEQLERLNAQQASLLKSLRQGYLNSDQVGILRAFGGIRQGVQPRL